MSLILFSQLPFRNYLLCFTIKISTIRHHFLPFSDLTHLDTFCCVHAFKWLHYSKAVYSLSVNAQLNMLNMNIISTFWRYQIVFGQIAGCVQLWMKKECGITAIMAFYISRQWTIVHPKKRKYAISFFFSFFETQSKDNVVLANKWDISGRAHWNSRKLNVEHSDIPFVNFLTFLFHFRWSECKLHSLQFQWNLVKTFQWHYSFV